MFNACRRGPASVSRILRAGSNSLRILSTRPSTLSSISKSSTKPVIESRWLHVSSQLRQYAASQDQAAGESEQKSAPELTTFQELLDNDLVHPNVVNEITKKLGHHTMTQVQSLTIREGLNGDDIIAQARTGTGKTLGFLLPTIQNILRSDPDLAIRKRYSRARPSDIRAIIISPTRELAEQIAKEAEGVCANTDLRVQVAVGGNSKSYMLKKMQREGCHLLVATPGRLNDLLTDPYSRVAAPNLTTLVLDEADRLLDDGFSKDIEEIVRLFPDRNQVDRQTLLFSATVPREVMHLVRRTLKPNFHFVQTVQEGEQATHEKVPQKLVAVPGLENFMPTLLELAKREVAKAADLKAAGGDAKPFKAIVYFSSTANVELAARVFEELKEQGTGSFGRHPLHPAEILEMHGQLTQQQRTRISERFRRAESGILFSTDVTARGMHFPGVTHVVQIGLPPTKEQYVHRVGRTGRADKEGEGWIFIAEAEVPEARRRLRGLPINLDKTLEAGKLDMSQEAQVPSTLATTLGQVSAAIRVIDRQTKTKAYMAALGQAGGLGKENVPLLNRWTKFGWGWPVPPPIPMGLVSKLGLSKVQNINIQRDRPFDAAAEDALNGPPAFREGRLDSAGGSRGGFGGRDGGGRGFGGGFGDRDGGRGDIGAGFGDRRGGRGFGGSFEDRNGGRGGRSFRDRDDGFDGGRRPRRNYGDEFNRGGSGKPNYRRERDPPSGF